LAGEIDGAAFFGEICVDFQAQRLIGSPQGEDAAENSLCFWQRSDLAPARQALPPKGHGGGCHSFDRPAWPWCAADGRPRPYLVRRPGSGA
jgi:hypothetical protein